MLFLDVRLLQKVSTHPVHILNSEGEFSPSAFIPFCVFGNNINSLGKKIDEFEIPVCNEFVAKVWRDQVCYEMDLNLVQDNYDILDQLKYGLILVLDLNEERQFEEDFMNLEDVENYFFDDEDNSVRVFIDSIGKKKNAPFGKSKKTSVPIPKSQRVHVKSIFWGSTYNFSWVESWAGLIAASYLYF